MKEKQKIYINKVVSATSQSVSVDDKTLLQFQGNSSAEKAKELYKHLQLEYPKFYKMDTLSKWGLVLSETLQKDLGISPAEEEVALVFANSSSCDVTDNKFRKSYLKDGKPSPSVFVYTLPNVVMGEIAIRNKWLGENIFAILPRFQPDYYLQEIEILSNYGINNFLCMWLEESEENIQMFVFWISTLKHGLALECEENNLNKFYRNGRAEKSIKRTDY